MGRRAVSGRPAGVGSVGGVGTAIAWGILVAGAGLGRAVAAPGAAPPSGSFWLQAAPAPVVTEFPLGADVTAWFAVAVDRTQRGRYDAAAAAYGAAIAAGAREPSVYSNLGEVLMAGGHLADAEASYRDAVRAATAGDDPRGRRQDLILALLGLAVALDRDGQPGASRQIMRRALVLDPSQAILAVASAPNADLFFVPEGDLFYYVGLAKAVGGHRDEARDAFREFLAHAPSSRWAPLAAAHVAALSAPARREVAETRPRVLAVGTVLSTGGAAAPLIDAAWRAQIGILDPCWDGAAWPSGPSPVRMAVELEIDARGRVTSAVARVPGADDPSLGACLEAAVRERLRLPVPPAARPTRARTEILVSFPSP